MSQITIGLAGHIDHGKTSLVKSLTGKNTDSLKEEIDRGMTIDIGLAFLSKEVVLIDVPGHERFVKNMMTGVQGIDIGLLVISADDSIMPQTREHFNILNLLQIPKLLIVINKIDLVDNDMIELVELEIRDLISETIYSDALIIKVSNKTKEGIDVVKREIHVLCESLDEKFDRGIIRMPIDRFFSIKGFGTVVTGTIISGSLNIGKEIFVQPIDKPVKVRSIQSHNSPIKEAKLGQRTSVNIHGLGKSDVYRGCQIVEKDYFKPINAFFAKVKKLKNIDRVLCNRQRIRIHLGTQEVIGRLMMNSKYVTFEEQQYALIKLESPLVSAYLDRFIIRQYSPILTLGGGKIIDTDIAKSWKNNSLYLKKLIKCKDEQYLPCIIEKYFLNPITIPDLSKLIGFSYQKAISLIKSSDVFLIFEHNKKEWVVTKKQNDELKSLIVDFITDYLGKHTYNESLNIDILRKQLKINENILNILLEQLENDKILSSCNNSWSLLNYTLSLNNDDRILMDEIISKISESDFNVPNIDDFPNIFNSSIERIINILKICESQKKIIRLNTNMIFVNSNIDKLKLKLSLFFDKNDFLSVADFKNLTNTSRKHAVPLLEYFDKIKFTYREGNNRKKVK